MGNNDHSSGTEHISNLKKVGRFDYSLASRETKSTSMGKSSKYSKRGVDIMNNESNSTIQKKESDARTGGESTTGQKELLADHLPPLLLVSIVLICSGILWVFAVRDTFATGRPIAGSHDEAMLVSLGEDIF